MSGFSSWEDNAREKLFPVIIPLTMFSVIFTLLTVYFDKIFSCCCDCFTASKEEIVVFNPGNPYEKLVLKNGTVLPNALM